MPAGERRLWQKAATLHDLGELTARWLTGRITSQPGYQPRCGPDLETRDLIPTLARACRAGYVTYGSQPGEAATIGHDGAVWTQRAVVDGWIATSQLDGLTKAARRAGLIVLTHPVYARRWTARHAGSGIDATRREGKVVTTFGHPRARGDITSQYVECGPGAIEALRQAQLVTIAAPRYGPDQRLWRTLDQWASA